MQSHKNFLSKHLNSCEFTKIDPKRPWSGIINQVFSNVVWDACNVNNLQLFEALNLPENNPMSYIAIIKIKHLKTVRKQTSVHIQFN